MPSRTVMIRKVVYDQLRKEKRRGESFSRLMERLLSQRHPIEGLYGAWGPPGRGKGRPSAPKRGGEL